jgi:hypothetical protein
LYPDLFFSEMFSPPWNGSEMVFGEFASIFVPRNGPRVVFSSAEGFRTEFRAFASSTDLDLHFAYNEKTLNCEKSMNNGHDDTNFGPQIKNCNPSF